MRVRLLELSEYPDLPAVEPQYGGMDAERIVSPDGTLELRVESAPEVPIWPDCYRAQIRRISDGALCWTGGDRFFLYPGEDCWSTDSSYLALTQWHYRKDFSVVFITARTWDERTLIDYHDYCHTTGVIGNPPIVLVLADRTLHAIPSDGHDAFPLSASGSGESTVIRAYSLPNTILRYAREEPERFELFDLKARMVTRQWQLSTKIFNEIGFPESLNDHPKIVFMDDIEMAAFLETGQNPSQSLSGQRHLVIPFSWERIIWDPTNARYLLGLRRTAGLPFCSLRPPSNLLLWWKYALLKYRYRRIFAELGIRHSATSLTLLSIDSRDYWVELVVDANPTVSDDDLPL
jgi:hypothetical protein